MTTFRSDIPSLRAIAAALGGVVSGGQVLAPAPSHSRRDQSMTVRLSVYAPDGFVVFGHAGENWRELKDYVRQKLGLARGRESMPQQLRQPERVADTSDGPKYGGDKRIADALALWNASVAPRGTPVERDLASRHLQLDDELAGDVIRWNARIGAMVALFRNIVTGKPQAVSRCYLDASARKIERKFLGPGGGAAVCSTPSMTSRSVCMSLRAWRPRKPLASSD